MKFISSLAAVAMVLSFSQCASKAPDETVASNNQGGTLSDLKVAYVNVDTLLTYYNYYIDLSEAMVKKSENVRLTLNQDAAKLQKEQEDFQSKYNNNAFLSQERAQQEYNRIAKLAEDLDAKSTKLQNELAQEQEKNSLELMDSISSYLKVFNMEKGYSMILSNTGMDNLLYADPSLDITQEVLSGLNARYSAK